ncbi:MAG: hypothetical protein QF530_12670, partial [SAR202 cluster bacterium]|nr:hypothetical protein [SAR202 cluster bacterium]
SLGSFSPRMCPIFADHLQPKLFINADPGSILVGAQRERSRLWQNQTEVTVKGGHFIQEISPHEIGQHIRDFLHKTA